jgi:sortase A
VTLPSRLESQRPSPRGRLLRWTFAALLALGTAFLAAGYWLPAKAELAQHLLNRAWTETAESAGAVDARPWPWADTWPVARLTLPGLREPLTVLAGASGRNLAFAPALMDGSAALGSPGVSVIAGHRDTHFRALRELAVGDELTVERPDGARFVYEVAALDVVDSHRASLRLDADESVVALVTCWPFDAATVGGSWRYVVTARLLF